MPIPDNSSAALHQARQLARTVDKKNSRKLTAPRAASHQRQHTFQEAGPKGLSAESSAPATSPLIDSADPILLPFPRETPQASSLLMAPKCFTRKPLNPRILPVPCLAPCMQGARTPLAPKSHEAWMISLQAPLVSQPAVPLFYPTPSRAPCWRLTNRASGPQSNFLGGSEFPFAAALNEVSHPRIHPPTSHPTR